jgi:glycerol-3-phosphate acyltransferase PlsY
MHLMMTIVLLVAYLLGSIPFGYILVRTFRHEDIRKTGSGNIGATNVARSGAKGLGIATLALDTLKGCAAVWFAMFAERHYGVTVPYLLALAALVAMLGHVFPVWLGFRGGKGVATALGVFLALSWPAALCSLAIFIVIVVLTKYVSLASVIGATAMPFFVMYFTHVRDAATLVCVFSCSVLVVVKHHANIGRLMRGTESKFGSKAKAS